MAFFVLVILFSLPLYISVSQFETAAAEMKVRQDWRTMTNDRFMTAGEIQLRLKNGTLDEVSPRALPTKQAMGNGKKMKITGFDSLPVRKYLIERLEMSPGNLVLLCATGCSGKTMLVQYIATCVSANKPLFGVFQVCPGSVVHIDQEQGELQTLRRYIRLANGLDATDIDVERRTLINRLDAPILDPAVVEKEVLEVCQGKALCIVDSLKACSSADENSDKIEVVLKMFKRVAEKTGCVMLVVHHKGKGKDAKQSGRGHSSIYDSADVQIDLEATPGGEMFELSCAKNREGKYFDGIQYQLSDEGSFHMGQNCTEKLCVVPVLLDVKNIKQEQRDKLIQALRDTVELKRGDLYGKVKGDRRKFNELVDEMIKSGELEQSAGSHNAKMLSLSQNFKDTEGWN